MTDHPDFMPVQYGPPETPEPSPIGSAVACILWVLALALLACAPALVIAAWRWFL